MQLSSGLPVRFDELAEKFVFGEGIIYSHVNRIPLASMLPGLLNKTLRYPETVYLETKNVRKVNDDDYFKQTGFNYDIVMLPAGLMGVEFIRSHIFYLKPDPGNLRVSEIVEAICGNLSILLQKNKPKDDFDFETKVSEGLVVRLAKGEKFIIPQGYYYTFINTKLRPVVFSRFYLKGTLCDYSEFRREQGLAYFAIRKNAKQEIVLNPRYRDIPQIKKVSSSAANISMSPQLGAEPLYVQIVNQSNHLSSLFIQ